MKHAWAWVVAAALPLAAAAQTYKWKDANGQVHFTQTPPNNGTSYELIGPPPPPGSAPNQDAINQSMQKSTRAAVKQQEAEAQAAVVAQTRQENCRKAIERIAFLDAHGPRRLATTDEKGTPSRMTTEEFTRQRNAEEEAVKKNCD